MRRFIFPPRAYISGQEEKLLFALTGHGCQRPVSELPAPGMLHAAQACQLTGPPTDTPENSLIGSATFAVLVRTTRGPVAPEWPHEALVGRVVHRTPLRALVR